MVVRVELAKKAVLGLLLHMNKAGTRVISLGLWNYLKHLSLKTYRSYGMIIKLVRKRKERKFILEVVSAAKALNSMNKKQMLQRKVKNYKRLLWALQIQMTKKILNRILISK